MWLYSLRVFRFRQYLQQFFVGEEEESRETQPLSLKVGVESLLNKLEFLNTLLEDVEHLAVFCEFQHFRLLAYPLHDRLPTVINCLELALFDR